MQFWINVFEELKEEDLFSGSILDKSLMQFCFLNLIQVHSCFLTTMPKFQSVDVVADEGSNPHLPPEPSMRVAQSCGENIGGSERGRSPKYISSSASTKLLIAVKMPEHLWI